VAGQWFSPGPPVSSTNRTDHHDITEILLKVVLNTIKPQPTKWLIIELQTVKHHKTTTNQMINNRITDSGVTFHMIVSMLYYTVLSLLKSL
jgi:hypothetical protein